MAWSPIGTTSIAQGKFVSAELMTKIKGNLDYLYGINGGGQGPEILNGSFEIDSDDDGLPDHWFCVPYAGGLVTLNPVGAAGAKSLKFTHPGGAGNGGGHGISDYFPVTTWGKGYYVQFLTWVSAGASAMSNRVQTLYFDGDKVLLGVDNLYNSTVNPTSPTQYAYDLTPIASCKFIKIRVVGGATDINQAGDAYFDDVRVGIKIPGEAVQAAAISQTKLKTSQGSVSVTSTVGSNVTLPGGEYGFYPQVKGVAVGGAVPMDAK